MATNKALGLYRKRFSLDEPDDEAPTVKYSGWGSRNRPAQIRRAAGEAGRRTRCRRLLQKVGLKVFELASAGLSKKQIALNLKVSEGTVDNWLKKVNRPDV